MLDGSNRTFLPSAFLSAILALFSAACAVPDTQQGQKEALLISESGNQPGQDSVTVVALDGASSNPLLPRQTGRSYLFARGSSLNAPVLVLAHEAAPGRAVEDHLLLYDPRGGEMRRLIHEDGDAGFASIAPDGERVAFEFVPAGQPLTIQLWTGDLTGQAKNLTTTRNLQDRFPVWRPDGSEIWFLRVQFSPGGVESTLMAISPWGGNPRVVFGPGEHIGAVAFGPGNDRFAMWTSRGLELVDTATLARSLILPVSSLPGYALQSGSLAWSKKQDLLALALVNTQTGASELWTVATDGANARPIYQVKSGRIFLGGFVGQ